MVRWVSASKFVKNIFLIEELCTYCRTVATIRKTTGTSSWEDGLVLGWCDNRWVENEHDCVKETGK